MLTYIEEFVQADGLLDLSSLEVRCREFYEALQVLKKHPIILAKELVAAFTDDEQPSSVGADLGADEQF